MYLIVYDIQSDRLRTRFAKFLMRHGIRIQYSVFLISNSRRVLENVKTEITENFKNRFGQADSVLIYEIPDNALEAKYGHPINEDTDLVVM